MKQVTINGTIYPLPPEANYVAVDEDGAWMWYENKPTAGFEEWNVINGNTGDIEPDWRESLIKVGSE